MPAYSDLTSALNLGESDPTTSMPSVKSTVSALATSTATGGRAADFLSGGGGVAAVPTGLLGFPFSEHAERLIRRQMRKHPERTFPIILVLPSPSPAGVRSPER